MLRISSPLRDAEPRWPRVVGLLALCLAMLPALCAGATNDGDDDDDHHAARNVVYVESNTPTNTILAFRRDRQGFLRPLPRSPFQTGGSGVHPTSDLSPANLGPFDSDQNIIVDEDGERLFAVNSGSDSIAVFDIWPNGDSVAGPGVALPVRRRQPREPGALRQHPRRGQQGLRPGPAGVQSRTPEAEL